MVDRASVESVSVESVSVESVSVESVSVESVSIESVPVEQTPTEPTMGAAPDVIDLSSPRRFPPTTPVPAGSPPAASSGSDAGIDISWTEDGTCVVELRGRLTRPMLTEARDLLWSRSPQDRLTIVVTEAVLTKELFAMLIAGRRRLSSSGVLEIVGLDAPGARHIANSLRPSSR